MLDWMIQISTNTFQLLLSDNCVLASALPGGADDVSLVECVVNSLLVVIIGPPVHTTRYLLTKEVLLKNLNKQHHRPNNIFIFIHQEVDTNACIAMVNMASYGYLLFGVS